MFDGSVHPKNLMQMFESLPVLRYACCVKRRPNNSRSCSLMIEICSQRWLRNLQGKGKPSATVYVNGTEALRNIAPLGSEFGGRIAWKLQNNVGYFPHNDKPNWYNV
jgi:hypothetical protein